MIRLETSKTKDDKKTKYFTNLINSFIIKHYQPGTPVLGSSAHQACTKKHLAPEI